MAPLLAELGVPVEEARRLTDDVCRCEHFGHVRAGEDFAVRQVNVKTVGHDVPQRRVEWFPWQRRPQFNPGESARPRGRLARFDQPPPNPATGVVGVDEEGSDARRVGGRVEQRVGRLLGLVAAIERSPFAPADDPITVPLGDVVGAVGDELTVDADCVADHALDLAVGVVDDAQGAGRNGDQLAKCRDVVGDIVVADGNSGIVDEITLTYVVIHLWDERRLIMPCSFFVSEPYENWTRSGDRISGHIVLDVDWLAPPNDIRTVLDRELKVPQLWDARKTSSRTSFALRQLERC